MALPVSGYEPNGGWEGGGGDLDMLTGMWGK